MLNTLYLVNYFPPNRFILNAMNIKSLSDCRFPLSFKCTSYEPNQLSKKLSYCASIMDFPSHIAGRRRHQQRKYHDDDFPEMIKLGQLYFTLAVHTAGCERGFSVQNSTLTPSRNRPREASQDTLMRVQLRPHSNHFSYQVER